MVICTECINVLINIIITDLTWSEGFVYVTLDIKDMRVQTLRRNDEIDQTKRNKVFVY